MLAWGLALSIYKCNLLGEKLYVPFFLCLLWPTLCACVCAKNDFTVCEPYVFSFFFFNYSLGPVGRRVIRVQFFFFFEELFCTSFLFFLSPFYTKKKKEAKIQIRKTTSTSGVEGKEKRHIQTRCFFFFFLALNKTKTMNPPFFF